jgi:hypothetical protein
MENVHALYFFVHHGIPVMEPFMFFFMNLMKNMFNVVILFIFRSGDENRLIHAWYFVGIFRSRDENRS